jgi:hypothetical protein
VEEFAPSPQGENVLDASMMAELIVTKKEIAPQLKESAGTSRVLNQAHGVLSVTVRSYLIQAVMGLIGPSVTTQLVSVGVAHCPVACRLGEPKRIIRAPSTHALSLSIGSGS